MIHNYQENPSNRLVRSYPHYLDAHTQRRIIQLNLLHYYKNKQDECARDEQNALFFFITFARRVGCATNAQVADAYMR